MQLLGIMVYPFLREQPLGRAIFSIFVLLVLVLAVAAVPMTPGFAYVYPAVDIVWPGSFSVVGDPLTTKAWLEMLFLSVTTMTSTGLFDIVPIRPHARAFVMLEQISGMLCIALVIARMIALTVSRADVREDRRNRG